MNNGQHSQGSPKVPNGAFSEGIVNLDPGITEQSRIDNQSNSQSRDHEAIGNKIMNFSKNISEFSETTTRSQGQFDSAESITLQYSNDQYDKSKAIEYSFDQSVVRTTSKGLETAAIKEAERIEKKELDEEDNADIYYETMRDMARVNTDNSYGSDSAYSEVVNSDKIIQFPGSNAATRNISERKAA